MDLLLHLQGHVERHFYSILLRNDNRYHVFPLLLEITVLSYIPLGNCVHC